MTLSDRIYIEQALSNHDSFKDIAAVLKKDPSTISKEIRKHRRPKDGSHYHLKNNCALLSPATAAVYVMANFAIIFANAAKPVTAQSIARISSLIFVLKLKKPPYVCNGCSNHACRHDKFFYRAKDADTSYEQTKHECRQGINLTPEERAALDELVAPLILNGQTMDHIFTEHKEEIPCSERTLYRYIDSGILSVRNIDLPRKVKYKPRRQSDTSEKLTRECTIGRTYTDFLEYLEQYPETNVVEWIR